MKSNSFNSGSIKIVYSLILGLLLSCSQKENNLNLKNDFQKTISERSLLECDLLHPQEVIIDENICNNRKKILSKVIYLKGTLPKKYSLDKRPFLVRAFFYDNQENTNKFINFLGINSSIVEKYAPYFSNEKFLYKQYLEFITLYSKVVFDLEEKVFDKLIDAYLLKRNIFIDSLDKEDYLNLAKIFKQEIKLQTKRSFPDKVDEQIYLLLKKTNQKLIIYPMIHAEAKGASGSLILSSKNPYDERDERKGHFLLYNDEERFLEGNIKYMPVFSRDSDFKKKFPNIYKNIEKFVRRIEVVQKDFMEIEISLEDGILWLLSIKPDPEKSYRCKIKYLIDLYKKGLISKKKFISGLDPDHLSDFIFGQFETTSDDNLITNCLPSSPGIGTGKIALTPQKAVVYKERGEPYILIRHTTNADDIHAMEFSNGVLTAQGGVSSHASLVARGLEKPCVIGCSSLVISPQEKSIIIGTERLSEGDVITIDGSTGKVYKGTPNVYKKLSEAYISEISDLIGKNHSIKVMANADTPQSIAKALLYGADGIGLCRTEHMFFNPERLPYFQTVILSNENLQIIHSLKLLYEFQKEDFIRIFETLKGKPITIRLLDPPLHEFLPKNKQEILLLSKHMGVSVEKMHSLIYKLKESNPMLGHRGVRLFLTRPEIYEMQIKAIFNAYVYCIQKGTKVKLNILVPFIVNCKEVDKLKSSVQTISKEIEQNTSIKPEFGFGVMIETPAAALNPSEISSSVDFVSFGTNDLTQMVLALSRNDADSFLPSYCREGIFRKNPFNTLEESVRKMMLIFIETAKKVNPKLLIGICGEQSSDFDSLNFIVKNKINHISCQYTKIIFARLFLEKERLNKK